MLPFYGSLLVAWQHAAGSASTIEACLPVHAGCQEERSNGRLHVHSDKLQSAIEQVVLMFTQRLQVQERITHQVADAVSELLAQQPSASPWAGSFASSGAAAQQAEAPDVMVVCNAAHMCMVARGVENHSGSTTTYALRGVFGAEPSLRQGVLRAFRQQTVNPSS